MRSAAAMREFVLLVGFSATIYGITLYDHRAAWIAGGLSLTLAALHGLMRK